MEAFCEEEKVTPFPFFPSICHHLAHIAVFHIQRWSDGHIVSYLKFDCQNLKKNFHPPWSTNELILALVVDLAMEK